ncbi:MAG: hypothetical protein KF861_09925 [Planctomycetaceae bacterium]|nr:hypothetical protein [Planctomycetaceae bacterium]
MQRNPAVWMCGMHLVLGLACVIASAVLQDAVPLLFGGPSIVFSAVWLRLALAWDDGEAFGRRVCCYCGAPASCVLVLDESVGVRQEDLCAFHGRLRLEEEGLVCGAGPDMEVPL